MSDESFVQRMEERATTHRANPTPSEAAMARALSREQVTYDQQKIIGGAIVDFFIPRLCLVLEVDGDQHLNPEHFLLDSSRTRMIRKLMKGVDVVRVPNLAALDDAIAIRISRAIRTADPSDRESLQIDVDTILWDGRHPRAKSWLLRRRQLAARTRPASKRSLRKARRQYVGERIRAKSARGRERERARCWKHRAKAARGPGALHTSTGLWSHPECRRAWKAARKASGPVDVEGLTIRRTHPGAEFAECARCGERIAPGADALRVEGKRSGWLHRWPCMGKPKKKR